MIKQKKSTGQKTKIYHIAEKIIPSINQPINQSIHESISWFFSCYVPPFETAPSNARYGVVPSAGGAWSVLAGEGVAAPRWGGNRQDVGRTVSQGLRVLDVLPCSMDF